MLYSILFHTWNWLYWIERCLWLDKATSSYINTDDFLDTYVHLSNVLHIQEYDYFYPYYAAL